MRQQIRNYRLKHQRTTPVVRGSRSPYYRRGVFGVPALVTGPDGQFDTAARSSSQKAVNDALALPVDCLFFDLDTSVPQDDELKELARRQVVAIFRDANFGNRVRAIRCNPLRSQWFENDLINVVGAIGEQLDALILPGCETADEVRDVQTILRNIQHAAGRRNRVFIEALIDSPRAFAQAGDIASLEDVASLVFSARFARTIGASVTSDTWRTDLAAVREHLPVIAAAHGKVAVDGVTRGLPRQPEARANVLQQLQKEAELSSAQGYAASWIGHKDAITTIQNAFTPTRERAELALQFAARYVKTSGDNRRPSIDYAMVIADWSLVRAAYSAGLLTDHDFQQHGHTLPALEHAIQSR